MDQNNLRDAKLAPSSTDAQKVSCFCEMVAKCHIRIGGARGFEEVCLMIDSAASEWVSAWREGHLSGFGHKLYAHVVLGDQSCIEPLRMC